MDALARGRRPLLIALAALPFVACLGREGAGPAVGVSDRPSGGRTTSDAVAPAALDGAAALPASYRTTFTKVNGERFVSNGHASGRWEVDVWANELAHKALVARSREVPVGAVVVQEHYERSSPERPRGPVMVMEKRAPGFAKEHGDWRWAVVGSRGQLVKDGVIDSCAGCHDDAPMDGLFPIVP